MTHRLTRLRPSDRRLGPQGRMGEVQMHLPVSFPSLCPLYPQRTCDCHGGSPERNITHQFCFWFRGVRTALQCSPVVPKLKALFWMTP